MFTTNKSQAELEYAHLNAQEDYDTTEFVIRMPSISVIDKNDGAITREHLFYFYVMGGGVVIKLELDYETFHMKLFENEEEVSITKHDLSRFTFLTLYGTKTWRELESSFSAMIK